jgi:hypothetical protein
MDITPKEHWIAYAPDFEVNNVENRTLDPEQQVTVEVHSLSWDEQQKYGEMLTMRGKSMRKGMKTNQAIINRKMFLANVRNVKNLSIAGKALETAEDIYGNKDVPPRMIEDIIDAIQDSSHLEEGEVKN